MTGRPLAVLIGAPGSGKTRVGKRLAKLLEVPFVDTDARIAERAGPIPEIFREHGEEHFRRLEREAVVEALGEDAVVSLGGGSVLDPATRADLAELPVVLLTVSEGAVAERIADGRRPLLAGGIEAWRALVAARRPIYESLARRTWDTSHRPMGTIAREIADWIREETTWTRP